MLSYEPLLKDIFLPLDYNILNIAPLFHQSMLILSTLRSPTLFHLPCLRFTSICPCAPHDAASRKGDANTQKLMMLLRTLFSSPRQSLSLTRVKPGLLSTFSHHMIGVLALLLSFSYAHVSITANRCSHLFHFALTIIRFLRRLCSLMIGR